jgi:hypothetical protein
MSATLMRSASHHPASFFLVPSSSIVLFPRCQYDEWVSILGDTGSVSNLLPTLIYSYIRRMKALSKQKLAAAEEAE